jgi:hypothetical protein
VMFFVGSNRFGLNFTSTTVPYGGLPPVLVPEGHPDPD